MTSTTLDHASARRAARNMGAMAASQILSKGVLFIWQLVLIPLLGPEAYGVYGTVGALMLFGVTITGFGMGIIVIREVARRRDLAGSYLSAALALQTLLGILSYIGLQAAAAALNYAPEVRLFLALAAWSLLVDMLGNIAFDQLQAQERMVTTAAVELAHIVLRISLAGLVLWLGWGLVGIYGVTLASGLVRAGWLWLALWRSGVRLSVPRWEVSRRLLRDGAPAAATALVVNGYQNADRLVTASLIGSQAVGFLSAAFVVVTGLIELLSTTVIVAVYPVFSRLSGTGSDPAVVRRAVSALAHFTLIYTLPLVLAVSVYADALISVVGERYAPTAAVLRLMVWYAFFHMIGNVFSQALLVQNRQRVTFVVRSLGLALNLALLLFLLPRLGLIGAPLASIAAELLVLTLLVRAHSGGQPTLPHPAKTLRVIVSGAAAALLMVGVHLLLPPLGAAFFGGALGLIAYGVLVLRVGLDAEDRRLIGHLIAALPGGARLARWFPTA